MTLEGAAAEAGRYWGGAAAQHGGNCETDDYAVNTYTADCAAPDGQFTAPSVGREFSPDVWRSAPSPIRMPRRARRGRRQLRTPQ